MELVTGFAGQAHVDPIDMAHVNAVAFGHDAYLLDTQNKLEPTLETANKLVVDTGDLMIQGHHFTVVQSEEIALQSGVSGQKRNALVCARYEKAEGTGVESASWVVKYGTSTTDTPTDPAVTSGNILDGVDSVHEEPIFRIEYDGITPGNPILLVPEFQSASEFRTSIDQLNKQTLVDIQNKHKVTYEVKAGIVTVRGASLGDSSTGGTNAGGSKNVDIGTMPEGLRPSEETFFYLSGRGGSTGNQANKIMPNGTIRLYNTSSSINWWSFTCVYPVG